MKRSRIRFSKRSREFDLSNTSIDQASQWLVDNLLEGGVERRDFLRMRLLFEEALINNAKHYGPEQTATAQLDRQQGSYRLRLMVKGGRFNPLKRDDQNDPNDWSLSLFSTIDMRVHYVYTAGTNVLRMSLPRPSWNPVLKIGVALVTAAIIGVLGNALIPGAAIETFSQTVLNPIANMWIRLLQAIAGPIIFLTALTATFSTKRIVDYGGSQFGTVAWYFIISVCVMVLTMLCALPFFSLDVGAFQADTDFFTGLLDDILTVIPNNLIEPFFSANTPQLLLIAGVTGYILAAIEPQVKELKLIIQQLGVLGMTVVKQACRFVPFFVGLLLCLRIWTRDTGSLGDIWIPLILAVTLSALALLIVVLLVAVRFRANPLILLSKLRKPFIEAFKRGNLDFSTVDDLASSCERQLGIDREFARAALPQGLFLYMPTSGIGIIVFILFEAQVQHIEIDQAWLVAAAALSVVLAVATPPMTGANLLSFVAAFSYLGITKDAFLDVMVFDLVFSVFCIAFDQAMLQVEMVNQADRMGFLSEEVLRAPIAEGR